MAAMGVAHSGRRVVRGVCLLAALAALAGCGATQTDEAVPAQPSTGVDRFADRIPPSTPASASAAAIAPTQINLSWSESSDNVSVTGYRIYRGGALLATVGAVTTYQDKTVSASTLYSYTVQALDAAGNASGQSPAAIATTPAVLDTVAPTTPTGVAATAISSTRINVSWKN